ncbi:tRNA (adenosine(37)-N6)-threonylcarbamoyltransferase complex dimerization subunit type 1 TsaB [Anaeromicropila herbilytica]|uniref:tRNA (Adenosine(37)-N6)-threonylcarbamoyltransferase complex dimerization subunit type 1 TsaB n=1 Tax=Anaeromicropila herbilytica TaxID=2785025 RepID=A0A7R7EIV5_9FIRM|nr:tRNA (adenosine(37)-N6)-threonylcarbamoyltransferase complex dimerization subunit type 1 TsaB [Anaeromicropila herbilytica]BCN29666.1 tRNA (adenosine(37)-N6)-threonylcarbamoyltransferase complex dimerization subunit type 1 TsaB [Anaeromicropila herbilytica]
MKILALDTSGLVASVAIIDEDTLTAEYTINYKKTHSQTLLPMIDEIVKMIQLDLKEIDAIAVSGGPGSFTGLRIGSATAKGLGLALDKPIIHIPTVDGLAYNLFGVKDLICPLMDAKRNQVYTGLYEFNENTFITLEQQMAVGIEDIITKINEMNRSVIFLGDGVTPYRDIIIDKIRVPYQFAPAHLSKQRAGAVASLAKIYYDKGQIESALSHQPEYLRLSQAERELKEKNEKSNK